MTILLLLYVPMIYFIWTKIIMMYYRYWFYTKQGIKSTGFPLPIIGNLLKVFRSIRNRNEYSNHPIT